MELLRLLLPPAAAIAAALLTDRLTEQKGFLPPGMAGEPWRRVAAVVTLAGALWLGVFLPLASLGLEPRLDLASTHPAQLFAGHALLAASLIAWYLLGFGADLSRLGEQLGLRSERVGREVGLGLAVGLGAWGVVLIAVMAMAVLVSWVAGPEVLPQGPPELVAWVATLPWGVRLLLSLSAGVVEEVFFRGLLQPRIGAVLSSLLFVLAHTVYQQPLLLVGVALLSAIYAALTTWRRSLWAAMTAHALFDGIQLLVVIPAVLGQVPEWGAGVACLLGVLR